MVSGDNRVYVEYAIISSWLLMIRDSIAADIFVQAG